MVLQYGLETLIVILPLFGHADASSCYLEPMVHWFGHPAGSGRTPQETDTHENLPAPVGMIFCSEQATSLLCSISITDLFPHSSFSNFRIFP